MYEVYPDGTSQMRTYDNDLRVASVTDAMGHVATYAYASSGNGKGMGWLQSVTLRAYGGSTKAYYDNYTYDAMRDVLTVANSTATVTRGYDPLYRLTSESFNIGGTNLPVAYAYDNASRITGITYPQGQGTANYVYDSLGRVRQVAFANATYASVQYDPYGRLQKVWFDQANTNTNEYENYSYDAMNRITAVGVLGGANLMQLVYQYDAASLVTRISDNLYPGGNSAYMTDTFRYDGNGRLAYASGAFSTKTLVGGDNVMDYLNYTYDALGNVLKRQDSDLGACQGSCSLWNPGQTVYDAYNLSYDEVSNTYGKVKESFAYNGIGSMTNRTGWTYTYDFQQELVKTCVVSGCGSGYAYAYAYDGTGRKVKEVDAMASTYTSHLAYVGSRLAYTYNATSGVKSSYVYLGDQLLFRIDSGSTTAHFYATDLSNNVRLVWSYSTSVNVELKQRYKPFGEAATPLNSPSTDPRFRYAEQSYSSPTKLYGMGARSYAPDLGRFTSRDPVGGHGYAYAADDPLSFWDPSGNAAVGNFFGEIWSGITTLGNDVVGAATAVYNNPFDPAGLGNHLRPAPGQLGDGQYQWSQWWMAQSPATREDIWIGAAVFVVAIPIAAFADVLAVPVLGGIAGAGAWLSGGLATIGDALGGVGDALGGLWDALTQGGEGVAAAQSGPDTDYLSFSVDLWWAGLRSGMDKFEFAEFSGEFDEWAGAVDLQDFDTMLGSLDLQDFNAMYNEFTTPSFDGFSMRQAAELVLKYGPLDVGELILRLLWEQTRQGGQPGGQGSQPMYPSGASVSRP